MRPRAIAAMRKLPNGRGGRFAHVPCKISGKSPVVLNIPAAKKWRFKKPSQMPQNCLPPNFSRRKKRRFKRIAALKFKDAPTRFDSA